GDGQPRAVAVYRGLYDLAHVLGDALAVVAEHVLRRAPADDLAHGALGDLAQRGVGVGDVEQVGLGIVDLIGDGEADVDDVLVARQHQPGGGGAAAGFADIDQPLGHGGALDRLDGPPVEVQARLRNLVLGLAEAQLDRKLVRLHGVDRLEQPQHGKAEHDQAEHGGARLAAAGQRVLQPVLAPADDVLQI